MLQEIDIDSDSYVIFPSQRETLKKLVLLGKQLNHRFDLAKKSLILEFFFKYMKEHYSYCFLDSIYYSVIE